jgi:hypothetical protein
MPGNDLLKLPDDFEGRESASVKKPKRKAKM